jgi:aminoacylase
MAVDRFREYLRIKTVQPEPDYQSAIGFIERQAHEIGLTYKCIEVAKGYPVAILSWYGSQPDLPSIMLNSHMDVVPVYPEHWSCDPFEAAMKENGDIVARGTQDMKSVGMQYLEAIRLLKLSNYCPLRTIHVTFVPDEEVGGKLGMAAFVKHDEFRALNVGFSLDEGLASPTDTFVVYHSQRATSWLRVTFRGNPGHASRFIQDIAAEKMVRFSNKMMDYRKAQYDKLMGDPNVTDGDVTCVNMTMLSGGVQPNVVPTELSATYDIRVTPNDDVGLIEQMLHSWLEPNCSFEWIYKDVVSPPTIVDSTSIWWTAFNSACQSL